MLVEINFLPEKEKRDLTNVLVIFIAGLLFMVGLLFLYFQYQSAQDELSRIKQEVTNTKSKTAALEQQLLTEMQSDYDELYEMITELEKYHVAASSILNELVYALPERGFFSSYSYVYNGSIQLDAYFDVIDDVALYTNALKKLDVIKNVKVHSIESVKILEEEIDFQFYGYLPRYLATFEIELNQSEEE